jgi:hypothetical protein
MFLIQVAHVKLQLDCRGQDVSVSPQPVLTSLEAAIFYGEHFVAIKKLLLEFNAEECAVITNTKTQKYCYKNFTGKSTNLYQNALQFYSKNCSIFTSLYPDLVVPTLSATCTCIKPKYFVELDTCK